MTEPRRSPPAPRPAAHLALAGFWLALVGLTYAVAPAKPAMFLMLGLACGVVGGVLQWKALDDAGGRPAETGASPPGSGGDWRQTGWGRAYRVFFWLFAAVLALLAVAFAGEPVRGYVGFIVGYGGFALARELVALGKIWQLAARRPGDGAEGG